MRRRQATALVCPEHGECKRRPSQLLLAVKAACMLAAPGCTPVVLEARLLPDDQHRFDLWWPRYNIAAEADGPQHFRRSMHGKSSQQQYKRDREIDEKCRQHGMRLLRFHYQDDKQWGKLLLDAIQAVQINPHCSFVWFTGSYQFQARLQAAAAATLTL